MKVKGALVMFDGSDKTYSYLCTDDIQKGDRVVVEARDSYSCATIVDVGSFQHANMRLKWVVQKIDTSKLESIKAQWAKMQEIRQAMNDRKKLLEEEAIFTLLAKEDAVMKDLVEQLKSVEAGTDQ